MPDITTLGIHAFGNYSAKDSITKLQVHKTFGYSAWQYRHGSIPKAEAHETMASTIPLKALRQDRIEPRGHSFKNYELCGFPKYS
jgi:hypothetical protein